MIRALRPIKFIKTMETRYRYAKPNTDTAPSGLEIKTKFPIAIQMFF